MKAIHCRKYGSPYQLEIKDIPVPEPKANEVLVKVQAAAINDYDWSMVRGRPYLYRLMFGLFRPKNPTPGMEMAGIVKAIGTDVHDFKVGDEVYGDISNTTHFSCLSEYSCIREDCLRKKPDFIPFDEAAAIPHASLLALQGLVDLGMIKENTQVLINGAGGGVGTYAAQIAKTYDCHLTGVDSEIKFKAMENLGYDEVIDYRKTDFTRNGIQYDLILDAKSTRGPLSYLRALKPGGRYVTVGGTIGRLLQLFFTKWFYHLFIKKKIQILALKPNQGLEKIEELYKDGIIKPLIDGPYPLERTADRIQYFGEAKHKGKVIIRCNPSA